jgi:hypothetical protein
MQPTRYIVDSEGLSERPPGRSVHLNISRPLYGGAAG